ncbi:MAG: folylpolyglutamate synthase/dihydrofolate synthase family protein [Dehalococcoidia bacterium]
MNYQESLDYILGFTDYEKLPSVLYSPANYDLRRMEGLLEGMGNPQRQARTVHIAGTKGKGSTAAMIASVLTASGLSTGLFTSPHLHTMRERIAVDGRPISREELARMVARYRPVIDALKHSAPYGRLTTFEVLVALAFAYFREKGVTFQVMEAGMGGRLDATNVIHPQVSIITPISLDHVEVLGPTLEKIAREKSGIIKEGSPVVIAPQPPEAARVLARVCREKGADLIRVGKDITWEKGLSDLKGQAFRVRGRNESYSLSIPLLGDHQLENAATAVAGLEVLVEQGFQVTPEGLSEGMARVSWPGRLQILQAQPTLVVDGAHNDASARRLRESLAQYFRWERLVLVLGSSIDKDIHAIVEELAPLHPVAIATSSRHPRAMPSAQVAAEFQGQGIEVEIVDTVPDAVTRALAMAGSSDLVVATGSLFIAAEVIEVITGQVSD